LAHYQYPFLHVNVTAKRKHYLLKHPKLGLLTIVRSFAHYLWYQQALELCNHSSRLTGKEEEKMRKFDEVIERLDGVVEGDNEA
jgi:hypothetical protein